MGSYNISICNTPIGHGLCLSVIADKVINNYIIVSIMSIRERAPNCADKNGPYRPECAPNSSYIVFIIIVIVRTE